jgi:GNAT superfamily N-acetyltransferase
MTTARRTYLEMRSPDALVPARAPRGDIEVRHESPCPPALYRTAYLGVGGQYRWTDRAEWTDEEIGAHVAAPGLGVWTLRVVGELAGFFELERLPDGSVQIAYFGLMPAFIGRGLGGYMLTQAVRTAWTLGPTRVWLHTCTFDHPSALPNYLARGFTVTGTEDYTV